MKTTTAVRSGGRASELRFQLSSAIQSLIDAHNSALPAPPSIHRDLFSPGLLSLDVQTLLSMGSPPQSVPVFMTLLTAASLSGALGLVQNLLAGPYGCSADETSRSGVTPLLAAAYGGHAAVLEALADAGGGVAGRRAEPCVENMINVCFPSGACGRTIVEALSQGPRGDSAEAAAMIRFLTKRGLLRVNGVDSFGRTPLDIALAYKRAGIASALCESGAKWTLNAVAKLNEMKAAAELMNDTAMAELEAFAAMAMVKSPSCAATTSASTIVRGPSAAGFSGRSLPRPIHKR